VNLDEFKPLFRSIGWSDHDAAAYHRVLIGPPKDIVSLAGDIGVEQAVAVSCVEKLKSRMLVAVDVARGKEVILAVDPKTAWTAVANETAWNLATELSDFNIQSRDATNVPAMTAHGTAKDIKNSLLKIAEAAHQFYRRSTQFTDHQWRQTLRSEDTAALLMQTLNEAGGSIRAVSHGARLPQVAQIWQALVQRMSAGIVYQRIADLQEILEHGLFIVERDIFDAGVQLWLQDNQTLRHNFYLVDKDFLVVLNKTGRGDVQFIGRFTKQPDIARRYRKRFTYYKTHAVPAIFALSYCRRSAAKTLEQAARHGFSSEDLAWLECLVNWGVFCYAPAPNQRTKEMMLKQGFIKPGTNGKTILNYPIGFADLREAWQELTAKEKRRYEYEN
jgi:hypothetical protein